MAKKSPRKSVPSGKKYRANVAKAHNQVFKSIPHEQQSAHLRAMAAKGPNKRRFGNDKKRSNIARQLIANRQASRPKPTPTVPTGRQKPANISYKTIGGVRLVTSRANFLQNRGALKAVVRGLHGYKKKGVTIGSAIHGMGRKYGVGIQNPPFRKHATVKVTHKGQSQTLHKVKNTAPRGSTGNPIHATLAPQRAAPNRPIPIPRGTPVKTNTVVHAVRPTPARRPTLVQSFLGRLRGALGRRRF